MAPGCFKQQTWPPRRTRDVSRRIGLLVVLTIVTFCSSAPQALGFGQVAGSPFATGSGPGSVASQLEVLARSTAARDADQSLTAAVPVVGMARAAQWLLARYGSEMTPFESSLLKVDELIGAPESQAVLSALSSPGKLTEAQVTTLRRLFASLGDNPALKLLVEKGRALDRSPKTLALYLAAVADVPSKAPAKLPSTGNAALDSVYARIHGALSSASVVAVDARVRQLLSGPGAAQYVSTLPPLLAAALIPSQTLETYSLASTRPRAASVTNPSWSATTNAALGGLLAISMDAVREYGTDAAVKFLGLLAQGGLGLTIESFDNLVGYVFAGFGVTAEESGLAAVADPVLWPIGGFFAGQTLAEAGFGIYYSIYPLGLTIEPSGNVQMVAGQPTTFVVDGLGLDLKKLGPEPGATVAMVPNGGLCPAQVCTTTVSGPDGVTATMGDVTTSIPVTVLPGPLTTLTLTPASATIPLGTDTTFAAAGSDQYGNPVDATANTTFSILPGSPSGWCVDSTCGANTPGIYTVTATSGSITNSAMLTVTGAPAYLTLSPASASIASGGSQTYTVEGFDASNNDLGPDSGATLSISPDGSCTGYTCTASVAGPHTVTATDGTATATATLTVTGALDHLALSPASASIASGGSQTYTVEGFDASNNDLGPDSGATLSISPDGSCTGYTCTASVAGPHTVTATDGTATATATLTVTGALDHLALSPASASIASGGSQTYTVEGFDASNNDLGPDSGATLSISPDGSCTGYTCTASVAGPHTVTATDGTATGSATLTVTPSRAVIDFSDLADGSVVATQYPGVTFASTSGNVNYVSDQSGYNTPSFICTGPAGGSIDCAEDTIVDFTNPVSNLTFDAVGVDDTGQVAEVEVYGASGLIATVPIIGDAGLYIAQLVDLTAYHNVTSIDITAITDPSGIGWTNFSFK